MLRRELGNLLMLGLAAAVFSLSTLWIIAAAQDYGKVLAALPFAGSALLMAGIAWKIRPIPGTLAHYRRRHRPLAGPRPGADLPQ